MSASPPFHLPLLLTGIFGALGVAAGAFGAHGLEERLSERLLEIWKTGALYHLLHSMAMLGGAIASRLSTGALQREWARCVYFWAGGVLIFSGSLYALALTNIGILGAITPIGGILMIAGWGWLVRAAFIPPPC